MNLRKIGFVISLMLLGIVLYKFYMFKKYVANEKYVELSTALTEPVLNYVGQIKTPSLEVDDEIINWIKNNYHVYDVYGGLLSCDFGIKEDESGFNLIFLKGEDGKISNRNFALDNIDENRVYSEKSPSFIDYIFNNNDYDIVLFGFKKLVSISNDKKKLDVDDLKGEISNIKSIIDSSKQNFKQIRIGWVKENKDN